MSFKISAVLFAVLCCALAAEQKFNLESRFRWIPIGGSRPSNNNNQAQECPFIFGCVVNESTPGTSKDGCDTSATPIACTIPAAQRVKCYWPELPNGFPCRRVNGVSDCLCSN